MPLEETLRGLLCTHYQSWPVCESTYQVHYRNGGSAGAISVTYQMLGFGGNHENLFQAAFAQSGSILPSPSVAEGQVCFPVDQLAQSMLIRIFEVHYDALISHAGCKDAKDTLECIRTVPIDILEAAVNKMPDIFSYQVVFFTFSLLVALV